MGDILHFRRTESLMDENMDGPCAEIGLLDDWGADLQQRIHTVYRAAAVKSEEASRVIAALVDYYHQVSPVSGRDQAFANCIAMVLEDLQQCMIEAKETLPEPAGLKTPRVRAFDLIVTNPAHRAVVYDHLSHGVLDNPRVLW